METKTMHTPGPWTACAGDDCPDLQHNGKRAYFPHVHLGPVDHVAPRSHNITINDVSGEPVEMAVHDANARLIAAAPDLYAALDEFDLPDGDKWDAVRIRVTIDQARRIRAALDKARGPVAPPRSA